MNLLFLDFDDLKNPSASGGEAYMVRELGSRLAKKHKVVVITGNFVGAKNTRIDGLSYKRLGISNMGFSVSILSYWLFLPIYVLINQSKYDVIFEFLTAPFSASFVPCFTNKPLIALPMFIDSKKLAEKYHLPIDVFQSFLIKKYKKFIVLTRNVQNKILKLNPNAKFTIIPGGISTKLLESKPGKGEYALYLGRIDIYNKGLKMLVEAWKTIEQNLTIAGSGRKSDEKELKDLVKKLGLEEKIKFVGRVSGNEKINLYRKSLFVVQPSLYETFGYVALETLASNKTLVCFDIDGFKWIPKDLAIKIKSISAGGLRQGIKQAITENKTTKNKGCANRNFAKSFTWDLIAKEYETVLQHYE